MIRLDDFKSGQLNIASLCKHKEELAIFISKQPFDILFLNETGLDWSIDNSEVQIPGWPDIQGEDRKKWPPLKIGFLDYNFVKRAENVEKFINRNVQLPNMTEGLTLLNLKCNFHHTNR